MSRRSRATPPALFRRTKVFVTANLVLWLLIGGWYLFQPQERQAEVSRLISNWADSRKNISAFDVAWDLWQLYGQEDFVATTHSTSGNTFVYAGLPQPTSASASRLRILTNLGYTVGYSDTLGTPLWAAYQVKDTETREAPPRPESFAVDPRTSARIDPADYNRSGYDRGHMAPNYAIATHYGKQAQTETFLMSNICPQKHALNAGPWRQLEERIAANYPGRFGEVWVLCGPIFSGKPARLKNRVAVPDAFFMIIIDESTSCVRTESFVFDQDTPDQSPLEKHLVNIDEIEARTGLDFLRELPDETEASIESRRASRVW